MSGPARLATAAPRDSLTGSVAGVPFPQDADPLVFFGQVGQVEVNGKRAGYGFGPGYGPARDQRGDLVVGRVPGFSTGVAIVLAGGDHPAPQLLDIGQEILALGFTDDLAEDIAEHPDVPAHRLGNLQAVGGPVSLFCCTGHVASVREPFAAWGRVLG